METMVVQGRVTPRRSNRERTPARLGGCRRTPAFAAIALLAFGGDVSAERGPQASSTAALPRAVDSAPVVPNERVALWNGRDLTGWSVFLGDGGVAPATVWSAREGVLRLDTTARGYLRTDSAYSDYHLHVEWRWPKDAAPNSNSGVMVHLNGPDVIWPSSFEAQLRAGNAGQVVGLGLDIPAAPTENNRKRAPRLAEPSEKPFGEWNAYDIHCRRGSIEVFVNGVRQNFVDDLPVAAGAIALQMEGSPIEFREVWLDPLRDGHRQP